jgi:hypothetical protein
MLSVCSAGTLASPGVKASTRNPARTLDDTDTDEIVGGEARNSTLPFRALMHVAG